MDTEFLIDMGISVVIRLIKTAKKSADVLDKWRPALEKVRGALNELLGEPE
jgi:hypothetical protein